MLPDSLRRPSRFPWPSWLVLALILTVLPAVAPSPAGAGSRSWDVATWGSPVIGDTGPLYRFTVKTEQELGYDADRFADEVVEILADPRSWAGVTPVRFQLVAGGSTGGSGADPGVPLTILLATPSTVDGLCAPLRTAGRVSCRSGDRVVLNADRWLTGPSLFHDRFAGRLDLYRSYVVNHEVGHRLGLGHASGAGCRSDRYAPVMLQQTYGLAGCAPNGWPAYDGHQVGREPDDPGPAPTGPCDPVTVHPWGADDRPLDDAVERLYRAALGRPADEPGLAYWRSRRAGGLSPAGMATELLASAEAGHLSGGDDTAFVDTLYHNVLGRQPDPAGLAYWLDQLNRDGRSGRSGTTRPSVLLHLADSAEHVAATGTTPPQTGPQGWLTRLYRIVLGRAPDCEGARYWLWSPTTRRATTRVFLAGPEFTTRYGGLGDDAFIDALYRNVLDRAADEDGQAHWLEELRSGRLDRSGVILAWTASPELIALTGTAP